MGYGAPRLVVATVGIWKTQRYLRADTPERHWLALVTREHAVVDGKRVLKPRVTEKSEPPRPSARRPDEPHLRLFTRTPSSTP